MIVIISESDLHLIKNHARSTYPEECCGFLIGVDSNVRTIHRALPVPNNNQVSRVNRYNVDPRELIRADEEAQSSNLKLIGIYHSHPDAPSTPSKFDLDHAWPWYTYLVLSVQKGETKEVTAWQLSEDRSTFHPDDLRVTGMISKHDR